MTTLSIISWDQGVGYDEAASVKAFAVIEKLAAFAVSALRAIRGLKVGRATLRPAQA